MNQFLVTLAINAHNEGALLAKTLAQASSMKLEATSRGISTEILVIGDSLNDDTRNVLSQSKLWDRLIEVGFGDLAEARNAAAHESNSEFVTFLDGDDFYNQHWIANALDEYRKQGIEKLILRPDYVVSFGRKLRLWKQFSQILGQFDNSCLIEFNPYASVSFALKQTYLSVPYRRRRGPGFSFEDWLWNADTIAAGYLHHTVPKTSYFYRRKDVGSLAESQYAINGCIEDSPFFDDLSLMLDKGEFSNRRFWSAYESSNFPSWLISQMADASRFEEEIKSEDAVLKKYTARCITESKLTALYVALRLEISPFLKAERVIVDGFQLRFEMPTKASSAGAIDLTSRADHEQLGLVLLRLFLQIKPKLIYLKEGPVSEILNRTYKNQLCAVSEVVGLG